MAEALTVASILAGSASVVVSAAALGTYRGARRIVALTEQNRADLRGAEPEDTGIVHQVRQNTAALREHGLIPMAGDLYRAGRASQSKSDPKSSDPDPRGQP